MTVISHLPQTVDLLLAYANRRVVQFRRAFCATTLHTT